MAGGVSDGEFLPKLIAGSTPKRSGKRTWHLRLVAGSTLFRVDVRTNPYI